MARLANSLVTLRAQVDKKFPTRSKRSDGWIGDAAHAARVSQHNPNQWGVVCAIDITEDKSVGLDCNRLMAELDASNDSRIYYLIHDRQIDNSDDSRTPYGGSNPHTTHLHISVKWDQPSRFDDGRAWNIPMLGHKPAPTPSSRPTIQNGDSGQAVWDLQRVLTTAYPAYNKYTPTGFFGDQTEAGVKEFQSRSGLTADGIVGPMTWGKLGF